MDADGADAKRAGIKQERGDSCFYANMGIVEISSLKCLYACSMDY